MGGVPAADGSGEEAVMPGRCIGREPNVVIMVPPMPINPIKIRDEPTYARNQNCCSSYEYQ